VVVPEVAVQVVWVSVAQVLLDLDSDSVFFVVPQLAVHVGDGLPLLKWVVFLDLSGGQSIEKRSKNLKQGAVGTVGAAGILGISIAGNVGLGTGDQ
jgi:hypothetical protein